MNERQMKTTGGSERGMVLVTVILLLSVITLLGTAAYLQASGNLSLSGNFRQAKRALYDADRGIQYVIQKMEEDIGTLFFLPSPSIAGTVITLPTYAAPSGFSFTPPSTMTDRGGNRYRFRVTGQAPGNAVSILEADIQAVRKPVFEFGLFADGVVDLKSSSHVYSYNSEDTPDPNPADFPGASTGEADVGSNTEIRAYMDTYIDGDTALGTNEAGDDPGDWTVTGVPIVTGEAGVAIERVDPDPLGALTPGSDLYNQFSDVTTSNDNSLVAQLTSSTIIDLGNGETMTLLGKPGGANYYITSLILRNGSTLVIDATSGPVNVFLSGTLDTEDGDLEAKNGSQINNTALPTDFNLYSNSSQAIVLKHGSEFKGMVYAPAAPISLMNTGDVYGLIWGNTVDVKNSGEFYFDTAFQTKFPSDKYGLTLVAWRDVRATVQ